MIFAGGGVSLFCLKMRTAAWPIAICLLTTSAHAMSCAPHEEMLAFLKSHFKEEVIAHGVMKENDEIVGIMETTVSRTGSWTTIATGKDNESCIFFSGENYGQQVLKPGDQGA